MRLSLSIGVIAFISTVIQSIAGFRIAIRFQDSDYSECADRPGSASGTHHLNAAHQKPIDDEFQPPSIGHHKRNHRHALSTWQTTLSD